MRRRLCVLTPSSSEPGSKQEGGRLLEDVTTLLSAKKGKLSSVELFVSRLSTDYVTLGLVRLIFIALLR